MTNSHRPEVIAAHRRQFERQREDRGRQPDDPRDREEQDDAEHERQQQADLPCARGGWLRQPVHDD